MSAQRLEDRDLTPGAPEYREGFADALRWVLTVFNLDTEDEDELNRVLQGGDCEGMSA